MFLIFLHFIVVQALPEVLPPPPPQDVHVNNWQLTWTPTTQDRNVTYSVQYSTRFHDTLGDEWKNVSYCVRMSSNSCDVSFTKGQAEQHDCVKLRVRANRHGLNSKPVDACSRHSDSCTPTVNLTARTGSLNVHLSRNHELHLEHADHAKHRVYFGKEGEVLKKYGDYVSSVTIHKLEEGQRYCVKVQYVYHEKPVGLSTCTLCEVIPQSTSKHVEIVVAVAVVVLVVLITIASYILIFKLEKIKHWLRPPCEIPDHLFHAEHIRLYTSSPSEEIYDPISSITSVK